MTGRKRSRHQAYVEDEDGIEVESASSSFRHNNANHKRTKVAMAQAVGGAVLSDEEADYVDEFLMDDVEQPGDDYSELDYTVRQNSSDDEQEDDEVDEIKATQFVERRLREHRNNVAADSGVIESVYMRNFMCHTNLIIKLGPLINFIIGHNGSGKSAVLTALQISLGNRASGTNRAKTLKEMIRTGCDSGMVGVKIKNAGENAYKHDLYGDILTVERHFTKSGSSAFKLKSTDGRIITTKKGDLDDVLDHFALQMDNPINVLTQDLSRQFLANSTPAEKYRFFIKGTQLETLDSDYNLLEEHLDGTEAQLQTREEMIAELRRKETEARDRVKRAERTRGLEERFRHISRQHAWAQVEQQEEILAYYQRDVLDAAGEVQDKERIGEEASARFETEDIGVEAAKRGAESHRENLAPLAQACEDAKEKFQENKRALVNHVTEERTIKTSMKAHKKTVTRLESEVQEERQRLANRHGEAHMERERRLSELKKQAGEAKAAFDEHRKEYPDLEKAVKDAQQRLQEAAQPLDAARNDVNDARAALNRVSNQQGRKYAPYHPKMEDLCNAIARETRFRAKPVGPMGVHVQLLKPEWSSLVEVTFGNSLDSFVVTSKYDQNILQSLSGRIGCPANAIIVSPGAFSTAGKEPEDENVDTILRVLRIDNPLVKQALVINHSAEQTVLIQDIAEGKAYMYGSGRRKNVRAVLTIAKTRGEGQRWEWSRGGGEKSSGVRKLQRAPRMKADREQEIQARQKDVQSAQRAVDLAEQTHQAARRAHEQAKQAVVAHKREGSRLKVAHQQADDAVVEIQNEIDANRPQDGKLQELEAQLQEAQAEHEAAKASLQDAMDAKIELDEKAQTLKQTMDQAQREVDGVQALLDEAEKQIEERKEDRNVALFAKNAALNDIMIIKEHHERLQEKVTTQEQQVEAFSRQALQISERVRVEEGQTPDMLDQLLDRLGEDVKRATEQQGGTKEQLVTAHKEAQLRLEEANNETKGMKQTVAVSPTWPTQASRVMTNMCAQTLKSTLTERRRRWGLFRKYISMRTRIQFNYLLSERSFRGRVLLDHADKKLDIHVEPDMTKASDSGRQAKTLSGGEKSFSTICLLLSIWEAMGSPIRCLDEFDVYMDSVNRAQSMRLMIQTARRSVGRQFILITPQSMNSVDLGDDVHVHK